MVSSLQDTNAEAVQLPWVVGKTLDTQSPPHPTSPYRGKSIISTFAISSIVDFIIFSIVYSEGKIEYTTC